MGSRDRPVNETEITPAMIEAGALALCDYDPDSETVSAAAARIFLAMTAVTRPRQSVSHALNASE